MRSLPTPSPPDRAEVSRLATQIRRLESRSGRQAAAVTVLAPSSFDPDQLAAALCEVVHAEVFVQSDPKAKVCRVLTAEFELADEPTLEVPRTARGHS